MRKNKELQEKEKEYEISIAIKIAGNVYNQTNELDLYLLQEGYCTFGIAKA